MFTCLRYRISTREFDLTIVILYRLETDRFVYNDILELYVYLSFDVFVVSRRLVFLTQYSINKIIGLKTVV